MRYLIIGLGIYGSNLARDLTDMGHEVIGADIHPSNVDAIKDYISTAYIVDASDEAAVSALPLKNIDVVIVAIGENFGASIKAVAILRKLGMRKIYARAVDEIHNAILEGLQVTRILAPEQRAAHDLVNEMELHSGVASLRASRDSLVMRFTAPDYFVGMPYSKLTPQELHGLTLIAAARPVERTNILGIKGPEMRSLSVGVTGSTDNDSKVIAGDCFICIGSPDSFRALFRFLN